jgi:hypothetical protein
MTNCSKCGKTAPALANYCPKCGEMLRLPEGVGRFTPAGERLSDGDTRYWDAVKQKVSEWGYDVSKISMPRRFKVCTKVPRRDYAQFIKTHHKEARERYAIEEHGRIAQPDETGGFIHAGWLHPSGDEPTIIYVRRLGAPNTMITICHEMLHIFEDYLGLRWGAFASMAPDILRRL